MSSEIKGLLEKRNKMLRTSTNEHAVDILNIKIKNLIDKNVNSN
jgi:hypothetical protein